MPKEHFSALSPEVRRPWSKIPPNMKAITLRSRTGSCNDGSNNHNKNVYKTVKPSSYPPRKFTTAHLYELLTELISEHSFSKKNEVDATENESNVESTMLVNTTSANAVSPGDIRKIMPAPDKRNATYNKK